MYISVVTGAVGATLFVDFMVFKIVLIVKYSSCVNGLFAYCVELVSGAS